MELNVLEELHLPTPAFIIKYGEHDNLVDLNSAFLKLTGFKRNQLVDTNLSEFCNERDLEKLVKDIHRLIERKIKTVHLSMRIYKQNGQEEWVLLQANNYGYRDGYNYVIYSMVSIQSQKEEEQKNNLLMKKYEMMQETAGEAPFDLNLKNGTALFSKRLAILDNPDQDSFPKDFYISYINFRDRVHPMERKLFLTSMEKASQKSTTGAIEYRFNVAKEGGKPNYHWLRLHYRSISEKEKGIVHIIGQTLAIDEEIASKEEAKKDNLTKLYNRGEIIKQIRSRISEHPRGHFVLMVIDIDNFKSINDTFGHTFGDSVIVENANTIRELLPEDALIGRIGGDEFVVFLLNSKLQRAESKASVLCNGLRKSYEGSDVTRYISASIGIAEYGVNGKTYEELFIQADRAMYRAKTSGKGQYQIADNEDFAPIKNRKKDSEERVNISQTDQNFLMFAISLMSHARDIEGSLTQLLRRTADRYHFDHILILEEAKTGDAMVLSNYFSMSMSFYSHSTIPVHNPGFIDALNPQTCQVFSKSELPEENIVYSLFEQSHVKKPDHFTVGTSKFEYLGGRCGLICYLTEDIDYDWSEELQSTIAELTRILSVFISLRFRMDESQEEIRRIQRTDQLTGLYTFEAFRSRSSALIKEKEKDSTMILEYLDINNFGYINDNYGYKVGDDILRAFATELMETEECIAACRIYSDFFLVLYEGKNQENLMEQIQKQHTRFTNMQKYQYPSSGIAICGGLVSFRENNSDLGLLNENATLAWKEAKRSSGHKLCMFHQELRIARTKEQQIIGAFYEALYRDDFRPYLQPKFDMETFEVYGAESLVRWRKTNGEILPPAEFLEPLERIGFITELDFYMFEQLLIIMSRWSGEGKRKIICSTNFSARHFEHSTAEIVDRIKTILNKYKVDPGVVELEITESVLMSNHEEAMNCLRQLKSMGFRIAIDDFGTGYSALSLLEDMPADVIKMDKSFISMLKDEKGRALLAEFAHMIQIAGKEVIFEGVETIEQKMQLQECGFTKAQGYLLNKPISVSEFEELYL